MGTTFIFTVITLSVLGLLLAVVLFLVAKKFNVEEDPLIDVVEATMPGANCGGCGFAGCRAFAEACVKSRSLDGKFCPVGGNAVMQKVAAAMGVQAEEKAPMVAVVRCNGTCQNSRTECVSMSMTARSPAVSSARFMRVTQDAVSAAWEEGTVSVPVRSEP